jgi:hypothetical protein
MIGWQQIAVFLIVIIGFGLLISSVVELIGRKHAEKFIDERGVVRTFRHRRRQFRPIRGLSGVLLLVLAVLLLWATAFAQSYVGLSSDVQVARVRAMQFEGLPHQMSVELMQFDKEGQQIADKSYLLQGDRWMLQGNILKFPAWMNMLGFHSGYKLTRLQGQYDDPELERNEKHSVIVLNGGDDDFFKTVYKQAWSSPFVEAAYGNAVILPADGMTYNIFVSQTGLYAKPARTV